MCLEPYEHWERRGTIDVDEAFDPRQLGEERLEILSVECPMSGHRLYSVHRKSMLPKGKLGKNVKSKYNKAANRLLSRRAIVRVDDGSQGFIKATIHLPDQEAVRVRELGARKLDEVPRTEIQELLNELFPQRILPPGWRREVLDVLGLNRETGARAKFLDSCVSEDHLTQ